MHAVPPRKGDAGIQPTAYPAPERLNGPGRQGATWDRDRSAREERADDDSPPSRDSVLEFCGSDAMIR